MLLKILVQQLMQLWHEKYHLQRLLLPSYYDPSAQIPCTIVSPRSTTTSTTSSTANDSNSYIATPMLLIGYGAYGLPLSISFQSEYMYLLQCGWSIAFAHIRGGNELGSQWHLQGKLLNKWNTFEDYLSTARWLVEQGTVRADTVDKLLHDCYIYDTLCATYELLWCVIHCLILYV